MFFGSVRRLTTEFTYLGGGKFSTAKHFVIGNRVRAILSISTLHFQSMLKCITNTPQNNTIVYAKTFCACLALYTIWYTLLAIM